MNKSLLHFLLRQTPGRMPPVLLSSQSCETFDIVTVFVMATGVLLFAALVGVLSTYAWAACFVYLFLVELMIVDPTRKCERLARREIFHGSTASVPGDDHTLVTEGRKNTGDNDKDCSSTAE